MQIRTWISALRLRTLPLAVSGMLMGAFLADVYDESSWTILFLSLFTATSLQILSNLANDYGDFTKGTDNENRIGNTRALQSGHISPAQMKTAIVICIALCLISGISLLYQASSGIMEMPVVLLFLVGIGAIIAALKYTMGKNPYGYSGWGDLFVFVFFGPVAVTGSFLLHTHFSFHVSKDWPALLPSFAIGLLSIGVLNTNNIRDIENDKASNKLTIPVKIGISKARIYHAALIGVALISLYLFNALAPLSAWVWITVPASIPVINQTLKVYRQEPSPAFNLLIKQLVLGTLLIVVSYILSEFIHVQLTLLGLFS